MCTCRRFLFSLLVASCGLLVFALLVDLWLPEACCCLCLACACVVRCAYLLLALLVACGLWLVLVVCFVDLLRLHKKKNKIVLDF